MKDEKQHTHTHGSAKSCSHLKITYRRIKRIISHLLECLSWISQYIVVFRTGSGERVVVVPLWVSLQMTRAHFSSGMLISLSVWTKADDRLFLASVNWRSDTVLWNSHSRMCVWHRRACRHVRTVHTCRVQTHTHTHTHTHNEQDTVKLHQSPNICNISHIRM